MVGKTILHYKILEEIGRGGMGVVYKARDTKLDRFVALKFLHPELTRDPEAKTRFIQEAQAAAALNHPHICTIYEIDEHNGQSFIAMEYIEGEGLQNKIREGPLPIDNLLSLAIQISEGLYEAHRKGIIHRDIKPGNIMLTSRGQVKILDFGLARLGAHSKLTKTDTTLGTTAYMSPEQTSGKEVDRRTDIWSLGVLLYEMITGVRPFIGDYEQAVVYSILNDQPEPITARRSQVPMELERIVGKTLAKNASERYPHIEDLLVDLQGLLKTTQRHGTPRKAKSRDKRKMLIGAGAVAVIIITFLLLFVPRLFKPITQFKIQETADSRKMLVVLPFENLGSPEDEYFANGTTDAITARLASLSGLGVISRQSSMQYKETTKTVRQIGEELGVDYILEGTVQRERPGDPTCRVRVIPQLIRVSDDTHIWADTYDNDMTEVFRVQSDIAERVASQLDIALLEPERRAIEKKPTANLEAYDNYLRGMDYLWVVDISQAEMSVSLFQKAVSLDPQFAEAWAGLTMAHHNLYWVFDRPGEFIPEKEAAKLVQELAPDLPETHLALGYVAYAQREFEKALEHFKKAETLGPSGETAQAIGFTLRRLGRWQEALNYGEKSRQLLPRSANVYTDGLGYTKSLLRLFDEAERDADHAIRLSPDLADTYFQKIQVLMKKGEISKANQTFHEMSRQIEIANVAEIGLTQGINGWYAGTTYRLLPDLFTRSFDAFESGPIERYRVIQPAVVASTHLSRAIIYEGLGDQPSAIVRYDSARIQFESIIRSNPQSAYVAVYRSSLGLAYAGLRRCDQAIRIGEEAVRMIPISRDAIIGPALIGYLAEIYLRCGKYDQAIDQLDTWLSVPSDVSVELLRVDPLWEPLRTNPRFQRILGRK